MGSVFGRLKQRLGGARGVFALGTAAGLVVGATVFVTGVAEATVPTTGSGVIYGCRSLASGVDNGVVRVIDYQAGKRCSKGERAVNWNTRGASGLRGVAGPAGARGATGALGATGDTGAAGNTGATGAQGQQGPGFINGTGEARVSGMLLRSDNTGAGQCIITMTNSTGGTVTGWLERDGATSPFSMADGAFDGSRSVSDGTATHLQLRATGGLGLFTVDYWITAANNTCTSSWQISPS